MKVKIVSGWSNPGGSTQHHISLTNLLNSNNIDCTFYGPHTHHLDKCNSDLLTKATVESDDVIISHFLTIPSTIKPQKHILSCHETNLFPLQKIDLSCYDVIQFVSNSQKKWHSVNHTSVIIPPRVEKVSWKDPENKVAGVIGSIDSHKQPHLSIERAIADGYDKVLLFGEVTDMPYFNATMVGWVTAQKATLMPHEDNKEAMYKKVSEVYHSSIRETYGLVEAECTLAGIPFNGPRNNQIILEDEEILDRWKQILDL